MRKPIFFENRFPDKTPIHSNSRPKKLSYWW